MHSAVGVVEIVGVADMDRDGHLDLVVAHDQGVALVRGDGRGHLTAIEQIALVATPRYLWQPAALLDVNSDGAMDVILGVIGDYLAGAEVVVLLGYGDGLLAPPITYDVGSRTTVGSVVARDFDRDGILDLAVTGSFLSEGAYTLLMYGGDHASVDKGSPWSPGNSGDKGFGSGDFNGDGRSDLLAVDGSTHQASILFADNNRTFKAPVSVPGAMLNVTYSIGDWNEDRKADLAFADPKGTVIQVLQGKGDGTFTSIHLAVPAWVITMGDVNNDKHLDLVGGSETTVSVLLGAGDGTFGGPRTLPNFALQGLADFDGDGKLDVYGWQNQVPTVAFGDGTGSFGSMRRSKRAVAILLGKGRRNLRVQGSHADPVFGQLYLSMRGRLRR